METGTTAETRRGTERESKIPLKMKAIVKEEAAPGARLLSVDVPLPGPNDLLVKVEATSICGTDLHIYNWDTWAERHLKPPIVFGHEFCGKVAMVGSSVTGYRGGEFVSAETHVVCGSCRACRTGDSHVCQNVSILGVDIPGTFAEYVRIPASNAWRLEPRTPAKLGSIMDPYGNAVHATLAGKVAGESVLITGVGSIGLFCVAVARAAGAATIHATDVNDMKLELARKLGATFTYNVKGKDVGPEILKNNGGPVDVVLEMSGDPDAIRLGFRMLRNAGRVSLLGIPRGRMEIDLAEDIIFKGATVQGILGRKMYETWYQGTALIRSKRIDLSAVITHELPLEKFEEGIEAMKNGHAGKVVLYP
jgi:threonine 3-dehydrogenase